MLLVANLAIKEKMQKSEKWMKPWHMVSHMRELNESYPMNTNIAGFWSFSEIFGRK